MVRSRCVFALGIALALSPAAASAQTPARLEEARARDERGRQLQSMSPPDFNAALAEYRAAYDLLEGHPARYVELNNIAECLQALGQYDRALETFERFLREGGPEAEGRVRVEAAVAALTNTLGAVEVTANVPRAEVWAESRRIGDAPGRVRVPGGRHVLELRAPGYSPARQEVEVASRQTVAARFTLEPLGRPGLSPVLFWSALGGTAVAAGVGVFFGARALSERSSVDDRLASSNDAVRFGVTEDDRARVASLSLYADVAYATAGVLAVGTAVLAFVTDFHGPRRESAALRVVPLAGSGARGIAVGGSF